MSRTSDRGQVGGFLEGRLTVSNRNWMPKSWLEVSEIGGASLQPGGRGLSLDRRQVRSWRIETHLARRGLFEGGQVRVVSQDPFGLFRMGRHFYDPHTYIVYPATEPLPNLDSRFAGRPADSRLTRLLRPGDHRCGLPAGVAPGRRLPPDSLALHRTDELANGEGVRLRTGRPSSGLLLDLHRPSHHYPPASQDGALVQKPEDNSEEMAVTLAASLAQRLMELGLPVGLAVNGDPGGLLRPDNGTDPLNRMMETLAGAQASNGADLPAFLYSMRPHLSHFHSVTVITANTAPDWIIALLDLKRLNVTVATALVDPESFGSSRSVRSVRRCRRRRAGPSVRRLPRRAAGRRPCASGEPRDPGGRPAAGAGGGTVMTGGETAGRRLPLSLDSEAAGQSAGRLLTRMRPADGWISLLFLVANLCVVVMAVGTGRLGADPPPRGRASAGDAHCLRAVPPAHLVVAGHTAGNRHRPRDGCLADYDLQLRWRATRRSGGALGAALPVGGSGGRREHQH